jgi:uncharacterized membrane protein (DUF373 family)
MDKKEQQSSSERDPLLREFWVVMTFYERFEHIVALVLSGVIAVVIVVSLLRLISGVFRLLVLGALDPLDQQVFQTVFGMIMTLLIAMEFKHSILKVIARQEHIIQVKTVILIAQLALARKFIILDLAAVDAVKVAALGFAFLALGAVHWLLQSERKMPVQKERSENP